MLSIRGVPGQVGHPADGKYIGRIASISLLSSHMPDQLFPSASYQPQKPPVL